MEIVLTIVGWFIAAYWAIRQVNLAHAKNSELQNELLNRTHMYNQINVLVDKCAELNIVLNTFMSSVGLLNNNIVAVMKLSTSPVNIDWESMVPPIFEKYHEVVDKVRIIEMWYAASAVAEIKNTKIPEIIKGIEKDFFLSSARSSEEGNNRPPRYNAWEEMHLELSDIQANGLKASNDFKATALRMRDVVDNIQNMLIDSIAEMNRASIYPSII